jgi:hypothetical protein
MKVFSRKRLLLVGGAVTSVGAAAALLAGATFGFFSSAGVASGGNTFTAGHVVVGLDSNGVQVPCAIGPMSPGDTDAKAGNVVCKYEVKYTGDVNAYLAMDLAITGAPGTPIEVPYTQTTAPAAKQGLYDGSATGLQFTISDGTVNYMSGTTYKDQATGAATNLTASGGTASIADLLVTATPITTGATKHITVNYTLPTTAGNGYNLATSTLVMRIHAVQADNNAIPSSCLAAGNVCATGMNWS